ncbi:MAG: hypothetical protein HZA31_03440 [Opitutae bacterium]|nr:hypothetical protein [Opitutae bacterium]
MKRTSLIAFALLGMVVGRAQDSENRAPAPPPENLTFLTDEYIYIPKFTFTFGARQLSGAKASFRGSGKIYKMSEELADSLGALTDTGIGRKYHDGRVNLDTRTVTVDDGFGGTITTAIPPDGSTNNWNFNDASQLLANGNIAMHSYSAEVIDTGSRVRDPNGAIGFEVAASRDMGKLGKYIDWNLGGGLSLNDIKSSMSSGMTARVEKITDTYSNNGGTPGTAPYSSPSSTTQNVYDINGNQVYNDDGTAKTQTNDTSTLISQNPISRDTTTTTDNTSVTNSWKLKGAYFTLRAGPTFLLPLTQRFKATIGVGPAVLYSGTTYTVRQDYQPETGDVITSTVSSSESHLLPGYYADANLEFWLTETAGFYAGAVFQSNGNFTQTVKTDTANYSTKVDLSRLSGMRAGLSVRF